MINIHDKTLQDLEFYTVLQQVSEHCVTSLGNGEALQISPFKTKEELYLELNFTNEYLSSFYNDNRIPNHGFEVITKELKLLKIEKSIFRSTSSASFIRSSIESWARFLALAIICFSSNLLSSLYSIIVFFLLQTM